MTKEEILEGNKHFAQFLGYKYYPNSDSEAFPGWKKSDKYVHQKLMEIGDVGERFYLGRRHKDLRFYNDWNWLMKVVEKVESLGYMTTIYSNSVMCDGILFYGMEISNMSDKILIDVNHHMTKRDSVFYALTEFVKNYTQPEVV